VIAAEDEARHTTGKTAPDGWEPIVVKVESEEDG
jgi:hypothetical protein